MFQVHKDSNVSRVSYNPIEAIIRKKFNQDIKFFLGNRRKWKFSPQVFLYSFFSASGLPVIFNFIINLTHLSQIFYIDKRKRIHWVVIFSANVLADEDGNDDDEEGRKYNNKLYFCRLVRKRRFCALKKILLPFFRRRKYRTRLWRITISTRTGSASQ